MRQSFILLFLATVLGGLNAQPRLNQGDFLESYRAASTAYQSAPSYETAWQFSKAAYEYATHGIPAEKNDDRKAVFEQGKNAAQRARDLNPRAVEGHYWFGVNLGSWAETNGIMASLFAAGDLLAAADAAVRINPGYQNAAPLVLRARVLHKAPGWPVSVGDKTKSEADFRRALSLAGENNRTLRRFYGDLLADLGRREEARRMYQQGIALPADGESPFTDNKEIVQLREALSRL